MIERGPRTWNEAKWEIRLEADGFDLDGEELELVRAALARDRAGFTERFWAAVGDNIMLPETTARAAVEAAKGMP